MIQQLSQLDTIFATLDEFDWDQKNQTLSIAWDKLMPEGYGDIGETHPIYLKIKSHVTGKEYVFDEEEFEMSSSINRVIYIPIASIDHVAGCPIKYVFVVKEH